MDNDTLRSEVQKIVSLLVAKNYRKIEEITEGVRLKAFMIESAIQQYGRVRVPLPDHALELIDSIRCDSNENIAFVDCPLWTREEGRSDLTLQLTISLEDGDYRIEIDDLHVL